MAFALEGQNVRRYPIEKPAIVGNDEYRAGKVEQSFFQGSQRLDIQIVGRFIQKQHIGTAAQQLCQMHAIALSSGKIADTFLLVGAFEIETRNVASR